VTDGGIIPSLPCLGLAKARGIKVVERAIMPAELAKADEMLPTDSAAEVTPVGEIIGEVGHYRFTPGALCRLMWEDFDRLVGKSGRQCGVTVDPNAPLHQDVTLGLGSLPNDRQPPNFSMGIL
jgi:hypothetical protein